MGVSDEVRNYTEINQGVIGLPPFMVLGVKYLPLCAIH